MKISTKTKLGLIFFALACFIGVVTSLFVNSIVTHQIIAEAQERVKENLNTARYVYTSKIAEIDRFVRWTSMRHVLKMSLKGGNIASIQEELTRAMREEGLDFLTLVDKRGKVVYRFHNKEIASDSLMGDFFVQKALEKRAISGTQILSGDQLKKEGEALAKKALIPSVPTPKEKERRIAEETSGMVLKSAHPILDSNGEVLGILIGGILLNRNYGMVDQIKSIVFKDAKYKGKEIGTATIFLGDLRISTNVLDREGNRAIGTRAMKEVQEQVLSRGEPWIQRAFVVDEWYITAYEPIVDVQGRIVGMLYVGMMENKYAVMKERLILLFFLFSMCGMLMALLISFLLSWKLQRGSPGMRRFDQSSSS